MEISLLSVTEAVETAGELKSKFVGKQVKAKVPSKNTLNLSKEWGSDGLALLAPRLGETA